MTLEDARKALVKYVKDERDPKKKLNFKNQVDRHKGFFAWARTNTIASLPANAAMLSDPTLGVLKERIELEYGQLDAFLETKVLAVSMPATDKTPPHLDLHDVAKPKVTTPSSVIKANEARFSARRSYRVRAIGWRAAAIHDELWKASSDGKSAILLTDSLEELIDRRLRMVERMNFQISRADVLGGDWTFNAAFEDGFRIRMFEYPRIPKAQVKAALKFIDPDEIEPPGTKPFQAGAGLWLQESPNGRLLYHVPPFPGLHVPPEWIVDTAKVNSVAKPEVKLFWAYFRIVKQPPPDAAAVIDNLFKPDTSWNGRSWLFCDHVISALHLESLLFAKRRRDPSGADKKFNALMNAPPGPITIGGFLETATAKNLYGRLLSMQNDPHFDNTTIDAGVLQIGDHIIIYNSKIFRVLSPSEWILENALVIDVDSDPSTGGIVEAALVLQGHGTEERDYPTYLQRAIAGPFNEMLNELRQVITRTLAADPGATAAEWNGEKGLFVRWDPYKQFKDPGPWWIKLELRDPTSNQPIPPAEGKAAILGSVIHDTAAGTGYTPPPSTTAVYFPLHAPAFRKGWNDYLNARRTNSTLKVAARLKPFVATGEIMPGLFFKKKGAPIPVIRPKVTP
jgi:hypothetical protein